MLSDEAAARALSRHFGDIVKAAEDLGVDRKDLRRLIWSNPGILDAAHERMSLFAFVRRDEIISGLHEQGCERSSACGGSDVRQSGAVWGSVAASPCSLFWLLRRVFGVLAVPMFSSKLSGLVWLLNAKLRLSGTWSGRLSGDGLLSGSGKRQLSGLPSGSVSKSWSSAARLRRLRACGLPGFVVRLAGGGETLLFSDEARGFSDHSSKSVWRNAQSLGGGGEVAVGQEHGGGCFFHIDGNRKRAFQIGKVRKREVASWSSSNQRVGLVHSFGGYGWCGRFSADLGDDLRLELGVVAV